MASEAAYEAVIGLEVHVQLNTRSKMFCGCSTRYGSRPNSQVCPVCLGYPGAMPVMNEAAIRSTVIAGLMIGARISGYSKFDRKSYFYPDMPKNYQISQYDKPLCEGGAVEIEAGDGRRSVAVRRIHLEEDVAKNTHFHNASGVDFNRAGVPLMEVVTEPDLRSPAEAHAFLQALKAIVQYAGISDCNLEEGNVRCDVNCSIRPRGRDALGVKTEVKNMNTFKGVQQALGYEIERQVRLISEGGAVVQETRRWDPDRGVTAGMRSKESAHDYRYFPEPDLMPVVLAEAQVAAWREALPELPARRRERLVEAYGITDYDAGVLAADRALADYYEAAAKRSAYPKAVANWVMTEVLRVLGERGTGIGGLSIEPGALAALARLAEEKTINSTTAKEVFAILLERGGDPERIVAARGLGQVSDSGELENLVARAMAEHPKSVADYRAGKKAAAKFLVGQVMRLSRGKANPQMAAEILALRLSGDGAAADGTKDA